VAAQMAADLGVEPHKVETVLAKHTKDMLRLIPAEQKAEFKA
jgi:hypothetical protein